LKSNNHVTVPESPPACRALESFVIGRVISNKSPIRNGRVGAQLQPPLSSSAIHQIADRFLQRSNQPKGLVQ
jgi:hypothetical protein